MLTPKLDLALRRSDKTSCYGASPLSRTAAKPRDLLYQARYSLQACPVPQAAARKVATTRSEVAGNSATKAGQARTG